MVVDFSYCSRGIYFAKYYGQGGGGKKMVLWKEMKTEAVRKGKGERKGEGGE